MSLHNPSVAILASGSGSTAEAFVRATQDGRVDAEVGLVVCNKPPEEAGIYDRMERLNRQYGLDIETAHISKAQHPEGADGRGQTLAESAAICERVADRECDHVALMGYMVIVRGDLLDEYGYHPVRHLSAHYARMSNTHPGPLPETADTHGVRASARVLELGLPESKHTLHVVSAGVDEGPLIAEHPVPVLPDDTPETLFDRVQIAEKIGLPYALDRFLKAQRPLQELVDLRGDPNERS